MKKIILAALMLPLAALAQTYPSPTFNSLTLQNPLTAGNGGTGVANSSTITLGGNLVTSGANPLTFATTGATNVTLPTSGTLLNSTTGVTAGANSSITSLSGLTTPLSVPQGGTGTTTSTGTGSLVLSTSPTIASPALSGLPTAPTQAQFDNSTKVATNAFVQRALGNNQSVVGISVNTTLTASQAGSYFVVSGSAISVTLPSVSSMPSAGVLYFNGVSGGDVINVAGSDVIVVGNGSQTVSQMQINPGDTLSLIAGGGGAWYVQNISHRPCANVMDFGGNNNGTNFNNTALTNALASQTGYTSRLCVYFPPGLFAFSSQYIYNLPSSTASLTIIGAGLETTQLYWSGGGGIDINYLGAFNSVSISNATFLTGSVNTGSGISLNQTASSIPNPANTALSTIRNVNFRGADGYAVTDDWAYGVVISGVSNVNFYGVMITGASSGTTGTGILVQGTSSLVPVVFNVTSCTFDFLGTGFYYGNYTQGVTIHQSNFTGGQTGVLTPSGVGNLAQLVITDSQFNTGGTNISLLTNVPGTMISNNAIASVSSGNGIYMVSAGLYNIVGNGFQALGSATNTNGIVIASSSAGGIITGNNFFKLTTAVNLQASSSGANVQSNSYTSNTTNVGNAGSGNTIGGGSQ